MRISSIALTGFLISQLVPNFGGFLETAGNGIPLFAAVALYFIAALSGLIQGVAGRFFFNLTTFYAFFISYGLFLILISPFDFAVRDMAIVVKIAVMYFSILCGYYFVRVEDFSKLRTVIVSALWLNIGLFFVNQLDPGSVLMDLYSFRDYGNNRFPGTWNYPYNLTVFLSLACMTCFFSMTTEKRDFKRLGYALLMVSAIYLLVFATQSRSGTVAFGVTLIYGLGLCTLFSVVKDKGNLLVLCIISSGALALATFGMWVFINTYARELDFRHLAELGDVDTGVGQRRLLQIERYFDSYLRDNPWRILIGYGTSSSNDFYLESMLNYVYQYGLFGFLIFMIGPFFLAWVRSWQMMFARVSDRAALAHALVNCMIVYIMLIGVSADIMSHYRFIPLFYFLLGAYYRHSSMAEASRLLKSHDSS